MSVRELTGDQVDKLKQALSEGSQLGAAELRMINTDVYKERLGADWLVYKKIINSHAAEAIKANAGEKDLFVKTRDGFGLFFFSKDPEEVRACSEKIAAALTKALSTERFFRDPPIGCEAKPVTAEELMRHLSGAEEADEVKAAEGTLKAQPDAAKSRPIYYMPLWHSRLERVIGSICGLEAPATVVMFEGEKYYEADEHHLHRDVKIFNALLADAYKLAKQGENAAVFFSINFKTFCHTEYSKAYLQALKQCPAELARYLTPRFVRVPPGAPQVLVAARAQALGHIFKRIAVQTTPDADIARFGYTHCSTLATSWKDAVRIAKSSTLSAQQVLSTFSNEVRALRMTSMINGVDTKAAFDAAYAARVDFISGSALCPRTNAPTMQFKLSLDEMQGDAQRVTAI